MHSNIGGSYDDQEMADVTLAWMMQQLGDLLDFDKGYLAWTVELTKKYYVDHNQPERKYAMGKIYNSMVGIQRLAGELVRTPGHYRTAPTGADSKASPRPLVDTHEYIHASVRWRVERNGKGTDDVGLYEPTALKGWTRFKKSGDVPGEGRWVWESPDSAGENRGEEGVLPEDQLEGIEVFLYELSQGDK